MQLLPPSGPAYLLAYEPVTVKTNIGSRRARAAAREHGTPA
ncbi:hypothetical protein ACH4A8_22005 [Streptomyces vietnamensis]